MIAGGKLYPSLPGEKWNQWVLSSKARHNLINNILLSKTMKIKMKKTTTKKNKQNKTKNKTKKQTNGK